MNIKKERRAKIMLTEKKKKFLEKRNRILQIREQEISLAEEKGKLTQELRSFCEHKFFGEIDSPFGRFVFKRDASRRICFGCGLIENSYHGEPFKTLVDSPVRKVSPEEAAHFYLKRWIELAGEKHYFDARHAGASVK